MFVEAGLLPSPDEVHRVLAALRDGFFDVGESCSVRENDFSPWPRMRIESVAIVTQDSRYAQLLA